MFKMEDKFIAATLVYKNNNNFREALNDLLRDEFAELFNSSYYIGNSSMYLFKNWRTNEFYALFRKEDEFFVKDVLKFKDIRLAIEKNVSRPVCAAEIIDRTYPVGRLKNLPLSYH